MADICPVCERVVHPSYRDEVEGIPVHALCFQKFMENKDIFIKGKNIFIGNSATFENNHLEIFELLKKIDLKERKIIVMLSYGNGLYAKEIIKVGEKYFGDKFYAVTDFMPIKKYNKIFSSCSIFIFNHLRQQALGNINLALFMGGRVFLREDNPIYTYYIEKNANLFKIDKDLLINLDSKSLSYKKVFENRVIIEKTMGKNSFLEKTKNLIDIAGSKR